MLDKDSNEFILGLLQVSCFGVTSSSLRPTDIHFHI